jgi:hypothetical protein
VSEFLVDLKMNPAFAVDSILDVFFGKDALDAVSPPICMIS